MIRKTDTNRALQKINAVIDGIENRKGIMVLVQDLFYSNGVLDL